MRGQPSRRGPTESVPGPGGAWGSFHITSATIRRSIDVLNSTLDERANLLATLISDLVGGLVGGYTITNPNPLYAYDVDAMAGDELARVLGAVIIDLQTGVTTNVYTVANGHGRRTYDAQNTDDEQVADTLATLIADAQTAGLLS